MQMVLRRIISGGLCVALQAGALCAPLVHAHGDDQHRDHHTPYGVHAHFGGHHIAHHPPATGTRAVTSSGEAERVARLQVFVAVAASAIPEPAPPPVRFVLPPAPESVMRRPPQVIRSHGPPLGTPGDSRAPPVLPS